MNKNDRRKLHNSALKYCSTITFATQDFSNTVEMLKQHEEEKLENLPESLKEGTQAANIEAAIEQLETFQDSLEAIENACEDIIDNAAVKLSPAVCKASESSLDDGPCRNRFQILLPDQLLILMKMRAMQSGISCNELICQAI